MMCSRMLRHQARRRAGARWRAASTRLIDWVVGGYHRSLRVGAAPRARDAADDVATLVITIGLYVVVPKGFLPPQDTGLVNAVMEAGPEVSFAEMVSAAGAVAECSRTDPRRRPAS